MYGLAVAGGKGVQEVLTNLLADMDLTMALAGKKSVAEIDRSMLRKTM
jgi:L-lactate dehydrogenase (cytochrome)